jgi:SAM-dependent methyltransferase
MKDNFSRQSADYASFRPDYPEALYTFLLSHMAERDLAWDCGTGNGQVAVVLARHFRAVWATDISARQLEHAPQRPNIRYVQEPANRCGLPDQSCDLVAVAQAAHWFDLPAFYTEVDRVLKPGGLLAIWGYGLLHTGNAGLDQAIERFYTETVGPYWDPERQHIDHAYRSLPFPHPELATEIFHIRRRWTPSDLLAYIGTWSAVQHYRREKGSDPMAILAEELRGVSPDPLDVVFPVFMRAGHR